MKRISATVLLLCVVISVCGCSGGSQTGKVLNQDEKKFLLPHSEVLTLESKQDEIIQSDELKYNDHFDWYEKDNPVKIYDTDFVINYRFEDGDIEYLSYCVETLNTDNLEAEFYEKFTKLYGQPQKDTNDAIYEWRLYTTDEQPYKIQISVSELDSSKLFTISYSDISGQVALEDAMDNLGTAAEDIGRYAYEFIEGTK